MSDMERLLDGTTWTKPAAPEVETEGEKEPGFNWVPSDHGWRLHRDIICVECPECAFMMAAGQFDANGDGYTCPNCPTPREDAGVGEREWISLHRPCTNEEHDVAEGKIAGFCMRCKVPWPCQYSPESALASRPPADEGEPVELCPDCGIEIVTASGYQPMYGTDADVAFCPKCGWDADTAPPSAPNLTGDGEPVAYEDGTVGGKYPYLDSRLAHKAEERRERRYTANQVLTAIYDSDGEWDATNSASLADLVLRNLRLSAIPESITEKSSLDIQSDT